MEKLMDIKAQMEKLMDIKAKMEKLMDIKAKKCQIISFKNTFLFLRTLLCKWAETIM